LVTTGFKIALINPLRSSRFAEEELQRTKTDAIDALGIARFAAQKRPEITQLPEPALQELRELVRLKEQLVQQFGDRVRQLHRAVDLGFPEFTRHIRTLDSELATAVLGHYPTAAALRPYRSKDSPASVMTVVTMSAKNWRVPCSRRPGNQSVPITANPTNCRCATPART
jgi:transposase